MWVGLKSPKRHVETLGPWLQKGAARCGAAMGGNCCYSSGRAGAAEEGHMTEARLL